MAHAATALAIVLGLVFATADARAIRSSSAKATFKLSHPCPVTGARSGPCGGYVIDHVIPLACGGPDAASSMRWQTITEAHRVRIANARNA